jgi:serine/threonine protein kinase
MSNKNLAHVSEVELEIDLLSKLQHKNIVKYFGVVKTAESLDILLEYCIGGSLAKLLETYKSLSESIIRKYTYQILEGLEYLHSHNIIHRDIKGANILVDRDGICKLTDFGGAKVMQEEIDLLRHSFRGTPNWMAPETVKKMEYTRFSDIWSIGCTVIEMVTGKIVLI